MLGFGLETPRLARRGQGAPAVWTPAALGADVVGWWDFADATSLTLSGANITAIADKSSGGRLASSSGSPTINTDGIDGNRFSNMTAASSQFYSLASNLVMPASSDFTIFVAAGITDFSANRTLVGSNTTNATFQVNNATTLAFRSNVTSTVFSISLARAIVPGFHVFCAERASGGNVTAYIDNENVGTNTAAGTTNAFTISRIGTLSTTFWDGGIGEVVIINRFLTAPEIALMEAYLQGKWRSAIHVDPVAGNNSNRGWSDAQAWANLTNIRTAALRPGARVRLKRGTMLRRDWLSFSANSDGSNGYPIVVEAYGSGAKPELRGSLNITSSWAVVLGNEYNTAVSLTNLRHVFWLNGANVVRLTAGTAGSLTANQYAYPGGNLHVNIGQNPTGQSIEASHEGGLTLADGATLGRSWITLRDLSLRFWPQSGVQTSGQGSSAIDCDISWNYSDGITASGAGDQLFRGVSVFRNGKGRQPLGSEGDGISFHGSSGGVIEACTIFENDKAGVNHEQGTSVIHRRLTLYGNNQNIKLLNQGAGAGTFTYENCLVRRLSGDQPEGGVLIESANAITASFRHCTVVDEFDELGATACRIAAGASVSVTIQNCIFDGTRVGLSWNGSGSVTLSYNCVDATTRYSGISAGANDVQADPVFVGGGNYRLGSGSPCVNAGTSLGVTSDFDGNPRPVGAAPDIGAFERQS